MPDWPTGISLNPNGVPSRKFAHVKSPAWITGQSIVEAEVRAVAIYSKNTGIFVNIDFSIFEAFRYIEISLNKYRFFSDFFDKQLFFEWLIITDNAFKCFLMYGHILSDFLLIGFFCVFSKMVCFDEMRAFAA